MSCNKNINSPSSSPYRSSGEKLFKKSRAFKESDHVLNSHEFPNWQTLDTAMRNFTLTTVRTQRVEV